MASPASYLAPVVHELMKQWPDNRAVNIVCHGHSVPAGYFATPFVDSFNAYPHGLHKKLKERFPFSVANCIVTARGGENSQNGAARIESEVLNHRADVLTLDYALNDRKIGLFSAEKAHRLMIEAALERGVRVILLGPSADKICLYNLDERRKLDAHNSQLKALAGEYGVGYEDVLALFDAQQTRNGLDEVMSWPNHPNARGHNLIVGALMKWFPIPVLPPSRD